MRILYSLLPLALASAVFTTGYVRQKPTLPDGAHCLLPRAQTIAAQEGNPGHRQPAPGDNCTQDPKDTKNPDHACTCHRECKDEADVDEFGQSNGGTHTVVKEDAKCTKFCYKDHCMCPVHNCE